MNPSLQIAALIVSALAGSGALGFFIRYGIRLAIVEQIATEAKIDAKQNGKDLAATKERVTVVEKTLIDIATQIKDNVSSLREMVSDRFKEMVPRAEHFARWEAQDEKMSALKDQITNLKDELHK